jgi:hypothetical protein
MLRISSARAEIRTRFARFRVQHANHYANASQTGVSWQVLSSDGSLLKAFGPDTKKVRSLSSSLVAGTYTSLRSAERRDARDGMFATVINRSARYMVHGRLSQGVPIDIACRLCDIQPGANEAASEQWTHGHEAEDRASLS